MERSAGIPGQRGPVVVEADKEVDASPNSFSPPFLIWRTGVIRFREGRGIGRQPSGSVSAGDPSSPAVTEAGDEVMCAYEYAPASEPILNRPSEVQETIKGLKAGKAPGPNGVPNRAMRHLPKRAITFITKLFNAVLRRQYFPPAWKHTRVISILKPSSYRPISLLDTVGKLFEKILLTRVLREVNERGLLRDEQFGFRPRHSTALLLARLAKRVNRNFDEETDRRRFPWM
jgi:hypothetical protein